MVILIEIVCQPPNTWFLMSITLKKEKGKSMTYKLIIDYVREETCENYGDMILKSWRLRLAGHHVQEVISK